jgi:YHS domain-containing protein
MCKLLLVVSMFWVQTLFAAGVASVNKQGVGIDGYDPVSYFKSEKPIKGDVKFKATQGEVTYWFANENNKQEFLKDPKKYEPQFGGWCAFAVADSKSKVEIDPTKYLIQDGRLLLFYKGLWGDTRDKWLNTKNKDTKTFLKDADTNWPETKNKEP